MPRRGMGLNEAAGDSRVTADRRQSELGRLVRRSHIFASVIRDILDVRLLQDVSPSPLTPTQFQLLRLMARDGQHQVRQIADVLGISAPAATKTADKLERLGLISRAPCAGDRRATLLSVSSKGRRLVHKYEQRQAEYLTTTLRRFRPREIEQFSELLERFSVRLLGPPVPGDGNVCLRCRGYLEEECPLSEHCGGCGCRDFFVQRGAVATQAEV